MAQSKIARKFSQNPEIKQELWFQWWIYFNKGRRGWSRSRIWGNECVATFDSWMVQVWSLRIHGEKHRESLLSRKGRRIRRIWRQNHFYPRTRIWLYDRIVCIHPKHVVGGSTRSWCFAVFGGELAHWRWGSGANPQNISVGFLSYVFEMGFPHSRENE